MSNHPFADSAFAPGTLPSFIVGLGPAPQSWAATSSGRPSAVAMLFVPDPDDASFPARVLLTRRSTALRSHKGQIGFPGGRRETEDASPTATALREMFEEVGIDPASVRIHGCLAPSRALNDSAVLTLVATAVVAPSDLVPSANEVAQVILPPWPLLTHETCEQFAFTLFGARRQSYLFRYESHRIWGLTAGMIHAANLQR